MAAIKEGDQVTVKNTTYGYFQVRRIHLNGYANKKCKMVEVIHSTNRDFVFSLIKHFRLVDCKKVDN